MASSVSKGDRIQLKSQIGIYKRDDKGTAVTGSSFWSKVFDARMDRNSNTISLKADEVDVIGKA